MIELQKVHSHRRQQKSGDGVRKVKIKPGTSALFHQLHDLNFPNQFVEETVEASTNALVAFERAVLIEVDLDIRPVDSAHALQVMHSRHASREFFWLDFTAPSEQTLTALVEVFGFGSAVSAW